MDKGLGPFLLLQTNVKYESIRAAADEINQMKAVLPPFKNVDKTISVRMVDWTRKESFNPKPVRSIYWTQMLPANQINPPMSSANQILRTLMRLEGIISFWQIF